MTHYNRLLSNPRFCTSSRQTTDEERSLLGVNEYRNQAINEEIEQKVPFRKKSNALYLQSGGATAVINATACGVIETARKHSEINTVYAAKNGILGALQENLVDTRFFSDETIRALLHTPGAAFGSCRYQLADPKTHPAEYERLLTLFDAYNIRYFLYNGGGDSQDTTYKLMRWTQEKKYPIHCLGLPKTIDNDLMFTDNCPGFGSVAKYVAISTREAGLDIASMCHSSTQVFILEVMGRHTGWIAAAGGLAANSVGEAPHIILFPEVPLELDQLLARVKHTVKKFGFCVIVASEGVRTTEGKFFSEMDSQDAFGHIQLGGVAPKLAEQIKSKLGLKYHWAVSDYLQRAARHIASQTDVDQAYAVGKTAIEWAVQGKNGIMLNLIRAASQNYQWSLGEVPLNQVANLEKKLPRDFISADGFHITQSCKEYLLPLIQGEAYPPYYNGLPIYFTLDQASLMPARLPAWKIE